MRGIQFGACPPRFVLVVIGAAALALLPQVLRGQDVPHTPQVVGVDIKHFEKSPSPLSVGLRPNTPIVLGFELKNATKDKEILRGVTVKVVQVVGDEERVIASANVAELAPNDKGHLMFDKVKGGKEKVELAGPPPFTFQLQVAAKQPKDFTFKRDLQLEIREPRLDVSSMPEFKKGRLSFHVSMKTVFGPHRIPVQLVLSPELQQTKKGIYTQTLTGPNQEVDLFADFEKLSGKGEAYLKVDGYDRAFSYPVNLEGAGGTLNARLADEVHVRVQVPRFAKPSAKFEVGLEVDGPLADDYRVNVALDRTGRGAGTTEEEKKRFREELELPGLRQQKAWLSVSPTRGLVCQTEVSDWRPQFDTTGVYGDISFRVYVLRKDPKTQQYDKVKLTYPSETGPLFAEIDPDDLEKPKNLFARVSQDESAATKIELEPEDKTWVVGTPLKVTVRISKRTAGQAPIAKVVLFRGKAPKDDKEEIKEEDIFHAIADAPDAEKAEWSFVLPAQTKAEPLLLSVQLTTRNGVKSSKTETITFKAPADVSAKRLFTIKGKVLYGEVAQPNLAVTLADAKGMAKGATKTDAKGSFMFENLPPGLYTVSATMSFRNLEGRRQVEIRDSKEDKKDKGDKDGNKNEVDGTIKLLPKKAK